MGLLCRREVNLSEIRYESKIKVVVDIIHVSQSNQKYMTMKGSDA